MDRDTALAHAEARLAAGDAEGAFEALRPHVQGVRDDERVALVWSRLLAHVADEEALEGELKRFAQLWPEHLGIALALAEAAAACLARLPFDRVHDSVLGPLGVQILGRVVDGLADEVLEDQALAHAVYRGLARICAEAGEVFAARAERAFVWALEADPRVGGTWLERARFLLRRRDWAAARSAAREAARWLAEPGPAWWMVACASTAMGDGATALEAWRNAGLSPIPGPDGLPVMGGLDPVLVLMSSRTPGPRAASPTAQTEVVRVQPLSPTHGVILYPTVLDLAGDVSDTVLFEGTPVGFVEGTPRFVALAVLATGPVRALRYAASGEVEPPAGVALHPFGPRHGKLVTRLDDMALRAALPEALVVPELHAGLPTGASVRRRYARLLESPDSTL